MRYLLFRPVMRDFSVCMLLCVAAVCLAPRAASAQLTYDALKAMSRGMINNGEVGVDEPMIEVQDGYLNYYLGHAGYILNPDEPEYTPIGFPIRSQLQVEILRKYRAQNRNRNFWQPVLRQVEPLIQQQLTVALATNLTEDQKFDKHGQLETNIEKVYDAAMARYARSRGLRPARAHAAAPGFQVTLRTSPPGGQISLIHSLDNRLAHAMGKKPTWRKLADPSRVTLRGKYHYRIKWPNRTIVGAQMIHVNRDGTLTLR